MYAGNKHLAAVHHHNSYPLSPGSQQGGFDFSTPSPDDRAKAAGPAGVRQVAAADVAAHKYIQKPTHQPIQPTQIEDTGQQPVVSGCSVIVNDLLARQGVDKLVATSTACGCLEPRNIQCCSEVHTLVLRPR